jgi:hypothetical protein
VGGRTAYASAEAEDEDGGGQRCSNVGCAGVGVKTKGMCPWSPRHLCHFVTSLNFA